MPIPTKARKAIRVRKDTGAIPAEKARKDDTAKTPANVLSLRRFRAGQN